ncbi:uncharacterized protein [Oryza sativa Japonica Group]|uniref:Os02g0522300 protein n=1 Tax=Oryza sativa subsp. japonica TaxID=39947 RepID=B7E6Q5_ORYSJ|nr:uncharacterized protein LOC4329504 [Oryza sativa Japonica Group]BAG88052.1 unnamed protein product [Oryza sativa Japonica Group]BAG90763.1 unnamed protein product [Oryza sativa Japonica Group]BAG91002.1 unnamed protein product [Oryza sativa Japonica Group]BAS78959.1 Os02g0522300 [Oryza sativa Japonica Group]
MFFLFIPRRCVHSCFTQERWGGSKRGEDSRGVDSDCRIAPTSDGRHDFMRTPIWACKYFMESLSSLLSNGSIPMSISDLEQLQSSFYCRVLFCPRCCVTSFGPNVLYIKLGPLGVRPRVRARHQHPCGRSPPLLIPLAAAKNTWALFRSKYSVATWPS